MPTVINNPPGSDEGSGMGLVFGTIIALIILALFFWYILPAMRDSNDGNNIKIEVPAPSVPDGGGQ